jgi:hypothetical protein
MNCIKCGENVVDCNCPDITDWLLALKGTPAEHAGAVALVKRAIKRGNDPETAREMIDRLKPVFN